MITITFLFQLYRVFLWLLSFWRLVRIPLMTATVILGGVVVWLRQTNRNPRAAQTIYHVIRILITVIFVAQIIYIAHAVILVKSQGEKGMKIYHAAKRVHKDVTQFKQAEQIP